MQMPTNLNLLFFVQLFFVFSSFGNDTTGIKKAKAAPPETGITLPTGFTSTAFADSLGNARHIAVAPGGEVFVKLQRLKNGKGIIRLKDMNGDGKADRMMSFGSYTGTGVAVKNGYLYASSNKGIFRYKLNDQNEVIDTSKAEMIVTGLVDKGQHNSKSIALDDAGNIYVNIGAPSNACQVQDRTKGSPGQDPCPILDSAAGIWQFKVDRLNQSYGDGVRYVTGTRNVVGLDWNTSVKELYIMQHGRDGLNQMFPELYTEEQSAELPAEELLLARKNANFGWPYCYYDPNQQKKILNPEYGGDAKKQGRCAGVDTPLYGFPGHWAPNSLLFYTGNMFPERYKNGAFIAFHGSWNRAPLKQGGYFVAFVPFKDGKPAGKWEPFAEGFAGKEVYQPRDAVYRPCGLAQGPDGSLFISDDVKGRIWKVTYNSNQ